MSRDDGRWTGKQLFVLACFTWMVTFVPLSCAIGWLLR